LAMARLPLTDRAPLKFPGCKCRAPWLMTSDDSSQVLVQSRGATTRSVSRWRVGCVRHAPWRARMALLAHGATRAGTTATHGHEHDGCRRSSRAGLLMNGRLPAANEGAR
jgi:hypothetical protein